MKTLQLTTSDRDLKLAGGLIRVGDIVAFPTETVYGLGANALDEDAVKSVYEAKGRPSDNPMIVHISQASSLPELIKGGRDGISQNAIALIEAFWPGPLTMIFEKSEVVPDATTGGLNTVAIRMPSNPIALKLIDEAKVPVAAPSANLSGKPSPTTAKDVLEDMDGRIPAIIMGKRSNIGIESTVVDLTAPVPVVLRPGAITAKDIQEVLGEEVIYDSALYEKPEEIADPEDGVADTGDAPRSPGMKYRHYAPKARVMLIEGSDAIFKEKSDHICEEGIKKGYKIAVLNYGEDAKTAAHEFFTDLRELDRQEYDIILIRALEENGFGFSVMNRMLKSAGYDMIKE